MFINKVKLCFLYVSSIHTDILYSVYTSNNTQLCHGTCILFVNLDTELHVMTTAFPPLNHEGNIATQENTYNILVLYKGRNMYDI